MQTNPDLTIWPTIAYTVLATSIANAAIWYTAWKNRKKPASDIGLQDAQTRKASADTLETVIRINSDAFKRIEKLEQEKAELQNTLMDLRDENRRLREMRGNGKARS